MDINQNSKYYIHDIEIEGFWGKYTLSAKLNKDINLFIGVNGSGKTTLLSIIIAILKLDISTLFDYDFDNIKIHLKNTQNKTKTVAIKKEEDKINYLLSKESYVFYNEKSFYEHRYSQSHIYRRNSYTIEMLKEKLSDICLVKQISVYRHQEETYNRYERERNEIPKTQIDKKIGELETEFNKYRLYINTEINKVSDEYRKDVFRKILKINKRSNLKSITRNIEYKTLKTALENLGLTEISDNKLIDAYIKKQTEFIDSITKNKGDIKLELEDINFLSNYQSILDIVDLTNDVENKKKLLNQPIDNFINLIKQFLSQPQYKKELCIEDGLKVKIDDNQIIELRKLSSGEKQLLILLLETLLQKSTNTIYIIDEPEISLHLAWQRILISSILKLNPNIQLIIATHAPEIVANYRKNIISMEKIIKECH